VLTPCRRINGSARVVKPFDQVATTCLLPRAEADCAINDLPETGEVGGVDANEKMVEKATESAGSERGRNELSPVPAPKLMVSSRNSSPPYRPYKGLPMLFMNQTVAACTWRALARCAAVRVANLNL
jgi:hypothetical protein